MANPVSPTITTNIMKPMTIQRLGITGGLLTCLGLIAYFLIMRKFDLIHVTELRGLNFIILSTGLVLTIRHARVKLNWKLSYLHGFGLACLISAVSTISFAVFIYFYFYLIDPVALEHLKETAPLLGSYITPYTAAAAVVAEGIASGVVISFCYMQYFQDRFKQ